jgi:hypothetical protein
MRSNSDLASRPGTGSELLCWLPLAAVVAGIALVYAMGWLG